MARSIPEHIRKEQRCRRVLGEARQRSETTGLPVAYCNCLVVAEGYFRDWGFVPESLLQRLENYNTHDVTPFHTRHP